MTNVLATETLFENIILLVCNGGESQIKSLNLWTSPTVCCDKMNVINTTVEFVRGSASFLQFASNSEYNW